MKILQKRCANSQTILFKAYLPINSQCIIEKGKRKWKILLRMLSSSTTLSLLPSLWIYLLLG